MFMFLINKIKLMNNFFYISIFCVKNIFSSYLPKSSSSSIVKQNLFSRAGERKFTQSNQNGRFSWECIGMLPWCGLLTWYKNISAPISISPHPHQLFRPSYGVRFLNGVTLFTKAKSQPFLYWFFWYFPIGEFVRCIPFISPISFHFYFRI